MQYLTFSFAALVVAAELQQTKCITPIGMYAFPMFTNATHCYEGTVRCIPGGYEQCTNNKFLPKHCECEGHFCHKSGQSLTCQSTP